MVPLSTDANGRPIPALRLKPGGAHVLSVSSTSAVTGPFNPTTRVIGLYATVPIFIRTGDATVSATSADHYLPEGFYYDISLGGDLLGRGGHSCLAAVRLDTDGTLYISEKE